MKINPPETPTVSPVREGENYKEKRIADKTKIKTDDVKIKEKNGVIKIQDR